MVNFAELKDGQCVICIEGDVNDADYIEGSYSDTDLSEKEFIALYKALLKCKKEEIDIGDLLDSYYDGDNYDFDSEFDHFIYKLLKRYGLSKEDAEQILWNRSVWLPSAGDGYDIRNISDVYLYKVIDHTLYQYQNRKWVKLF